MELISHHLCPSLHTTIILLEKKGLKRNQDFKVTYVPIYDLPPSLFELSPRGHMPILKTSNNKILVRASTINEYIDEKFPPGFLPPEAHERALHRELILACSDLLNQLKVVFTAKEETTISSAIDKLFKGLKDINGQLLPFIAKHGQNKVQMVESNFGALFTLMLNFDKLKNDQRWDSLPTLKTYSETLVADPIVSGAKCPDYNEEFNKFFNHFGSLFRLKS